MGWERGSPFSKKPREVVGIWVEISSLSFFW